MIPILLDTDIGTDVDDAIALALVLASPQLDLRAVTTVSGNVDLRARIAKKMLMLAGRGEVPVAAGIREPVLRQRSFLWMGHEGSKIVDTEESLPLADAHGIDLLIDTVLRERPHLVAIGPLSNLAVAIMKEPAVIAAIEHLTVMGGVFEIGNDPAVPMMDYNLGSDPEASLVALSAGIPTTLVPLDVTWKVRFTQTELARLRNVNSPLAQVLCDAIETWWPLHQAMFGGQGAYPPDVVAFLHDPLTVAAVFERTFLTVGKRHLQPAIREGMFQLLEDESATTFNVVEQVDAAAFVEFLVDRIAHAAC